MDLLLDPDGNGMVGQEKRTLVTEACVEVLKRLRKLAKAVEAFRVTFPANQRAKSSVSIEIHFSDPLGSKCSYELKHYFSGDDKDTVGSIADNIYRDGFLEKAVHDHIERGHSKFVSAGEKFAYLRT